MTEPELPGLDDFRAYMEGMGLIVRRIQEWPPEGTEPYEPYWQVYLAKEERRFDNKLYAQVMTVSDETITRSYLPQWDVLAELLQTAFERTLEENRVSDEDERIHGIQKMLEQPDWQRQGLDSKFYFLLEVVERLKEKERLLEDEIKWNWGKSAEDRAALSAIADKQQNALRIIRENGFVFDELGAEPGNWQHLAFTLYTEICEIDTIARQALGIEIGATDTHGRI